MCNKGMLDRERGLCTLLGKVRFGREGSKQVWIALCSDSSKYEGGKERRGNVRSDEDIRWCSCEEVR